MKMYFTYDGQTDLFELRNAMKSTVKRIKTVALIYDNKTFALEEYGEMEEMELRLLSFANRKIYHKEMVKSDSWDLEYLNKLMSGRINFHDIDQGIAKDFADKYRLVYYRPQKIHEYKV